jgi:hypothetical protein
MYERRGHRMASAMTATTPPGAASAFTRRLPRRPDVFAARIRFLAMVAEPPRPRCIVARAFCVRAVRGASRPSTFLTLDNARMMLLQDRGGRDGGAGVWTLIILAGWDRSVDRLEPSRCRRVVVALLLSRWGRYRSDDRPSPRAPWRRRPRADCLTARLHYATAPDAVSLWTLGTLGAFRGLATWARRAIR